MNHRGELRSLHDLLQPTLARLGVDDLPTMLSIIDEWEQLAGDAWTEHASPVVLRRTKLVIEVANPMAVRLLRYGQHDLLGVLQARFGPHAVTEVEVVAPSR